MRYRDLGLVRLEELENMVKMLDGAYNRAGNQYEKQQIYERIQEKISEIRTLISVDHQE